MEYPFYLNGKFWQACKVSDKTNAVVVDSGCGLTFEKKEYRETEYRAGEGQGVLEVFACESPYCAVNSVGEIEPVPCEPRNAQAKGILFEGRDFMEDHYQHQGSGFSSRDFSAEIDYIKRFLVEKFGE